MRRFAGCLVLLLMAGCGGPQGPQVAAVSGKVMIDGKPAVGVYVSFVPDTDRQTTGPQSSGVSNDKGEFKVYAPGNREGAIVGFHKVILTCPMGAMAGSSGSGAVPSGETTDCRLASKFSKPETTPLKQEVPADGLKDVVLEATSK